MVFHLARTAVLSIKGVCMQRERCSSERGAELGATEDGLGRVQGFVLLEIVHRKYESLSVFFKTFWLVEFPMLTSEAPKYPTILGLHQDECWTLLLNQALKFRHFPSINRPTVQKFERCLLVWYLGDQPVLLMKLLNQLGLETLNLDSSPLSASDLLQNAGLFHDNFHAHASLFDWRYQLVKHSFRMLFKSKYRCLK
jgi:hypothetical protein